MKKFLLIVVLSFITSCTHLKQTEELFIYNANNEPIYVKTEGLSNASYHKLVFIEHGLASNLHHQAVTAAKKAFLNNGYVVITFDARYSLGNSGNEVKFVSLETMREDLETVINWAKNKPFYSAPFALSGHSLGGGSVIKYAAENKKDVGILIPITPVISGDLWEESCMKNLPDFCPVWKKNGTYQYTDEKNHKTAVIPYKVVTETKKYNANRLAKNIHAKTLIIGAASDIIINPKDINELAKNIKKAQAVVIPSSGHNFETNKNQADLYHTINTFLK